MRVPLEPLFCYNLIMNSTLNISEKHFLSFFNNKTFDANVFNSDGSLNKNYNSFKKTGTIPKIFEDHWIDVYSNNKILIDKHRPNANKEINKIIDCHNKNLGCSVYECPDCGDIIFVGHTCKSRICSSCGYKYKNSRVESILQTSYNCPHRHIVFTIPEELRKFFFSPFNERINILFKAVNDTIYSILNISYRKNSKGIIKKYVSKVKYYPGFFAFLHTFGRDLKWNPHIHILIAELKLGNNNSCIPWNYFDFNSLSLRFQNILLSLLSKSIGKSFSSTKNHLFFKYPNGFYVYAEAKKFKNLRSSIEYVTRYCGRVPISENRIVNYDGTNVTFSYIDHKDNKYHESTIHAHNFIMILLRHLIPTQFKIIRYYGFYRQKLPIHNKMNLLIHKEKRNFRKQLLKYEASILLNFNREPYNCPRCNSRMKFMVFLN